MGRGTRADQPDLTPPWERRRDSASSDQPAQRQSAKTAAAALLLGEDEGAAKLRRPALVSEVVTVGQARSRLQLFSAETTTGVEIPAVRINGQAVYPIAAPNPEHDDAIDSPVRIAPQLSAALWEIFVQRGRTLTSDELRHHLHGAYGVGTAQVTRGHADRPLGDPTARNAIREWTARTLVPLTSRGADGASGFTLARSREELVAYEESLRGRIQEFKAAARGIDAGAERWSGERPTHCQRSKAQNSAWASEDVRRAVARLEQGPVTSTELAKTLGSSWTSVRVRELIHDLRAEAQQPIISVGQKGYRYATTPDEARRYLADLGQRAAAIEERADSAARAGRLWFPQSEEELSLRRRIEAGGVTPPRAPSARSERDGQKSQATKKRRREARAKALRAAAESRLAEIDPWLLAEAQDRYHANVASKAEKALVEEARVVRQVIERGVVPRGAGKSYGWLPS